MSNMDLLKKMCAIHAPSGDEQLMQEFLLDYISVNKKKWKTQPEVITGKEFQHCIILVFGKPRTAVFAHIDNIGFTVRYNKQLVKVGGPVTQTGFRLTGTDEHGTRECKLIADKPNELKYEAQVEYERGTALSFVSDFREDDDYVQSCYLDNRLGVYSALQLAETLEHGIIVFSCREEHGGGTVPFIAKYIFERYSIMQALISDITWITEGVHHGEGVVVSLRDSGIPRKIYTDRIRSILKRNAVKFQLEVEGTGGSDGNELQRQPYPFDWCFVGAAEDFVHSPDEKVHKADITSMIEAYKVLMREL